MLTEQNYNIKINETKKLKIKKITLGTKEWSDYSVNCINGCSNNCRYCYAKKMAIRFGRKTEKTWPVMEIREHDLNKKYKKRKGRFMFPTAHDITPDLEVIDACFKVLRNILEPGNEVLITTKPHPVVIKKICNIFGNFKEQIQFRFTITSNNEKLLRFWEPGAPSFKQRLWALKYAYQKGFKTSISIEPFLSDPVVFIDDLIPYVSESIWIGPMNYIKATKIKENEKEYYKMIRKLNEPENLLKIYRKVINIPLVRIKDAFENKLLRAGISNSLIKT
ncbi:MAG: radical SAM protein [Promethearchaeota archaeon]